MSKRNKYLFLALLLLFSGCATFQYIPRENIRWASGRLEAYLPKGWVKAPAFTYLLFLTKDGIPLQNISVLKQNVDKELPLTKKKLKGLTLTQDIADVMVNEAMLNQTYQNFKLLENAPVDLGGTNAFRLVYTFHTEGFLPYKAIVYGFVLDKNYYEITYLAAQQHYFNKSLSDFEAFMKSFKIKEKK